MLSFVWVERAIKQQFTPAGRGLAPAVRRRAHRHGKTAGSLPKPR